MEVKLKTVKPFTVAGLQVRTRNTDEQRLDTARIAPMWQQFFTEELFDKIPARQSESFVYGVYSNYESDATGHFDVTAGVQVYEASAGYPAGGGGGHRRRGIPGVFGQGEDARLRDPGLGPDLGVLRG